MTATSLTGDPATDALVPVATRLIWAVRTGDQTAVADALNDATTALHGTADPYAALAVVLAAMVPDDRSSGELLEWHTNPAEYLRLRASGVDSTTAGHLAVCAADTGKVA